MINIDDFIYEDDYDSLYGLPLCNNIITSLLNTKDCMKLTDDEFFAIYNKDADNFRMIREYETIVESKIDSLKDQFHVNCKVAEAKNLATEYVKTYDEDYKKLLELREKVKPTCEIIEKTYFGMVYRSAKTFADMNGLYNQLDNFISDALLGLHKAIFSYDPILKNKFSTVAYRYIYEELRNNLYSKSFSTLNKRSDYQFTTRLKKLFDKYHLDLKLSYDDTIDRIYEYFAGEIAREHIYNVLFSTGRCKLLVEANENDASENDLITYDCVSSTQDFSDNLVSDITSRENISKLTDILKSILNKNLYDTYIRYVGVYDKPRGFTDIAREDNVSTQAIDQRIKRAKKIIQDNIELFEEIRRTL